MQDLTFFVDKLGKGQGLADTTEVPVSAVGFDGFLMGALQLSLVELQGFLLGSLGGIGHIALARFLDSEDFADLATTDEHFSKEGTSIFVVQSVDGEDLLAIYIGQTQYLLNLTETLLNFDWSRSIITSELLIMASLTTGLPMMS